MSGEPVVLNLHKQEPVYQGEGIPDLHVSVCRPLPPFDEAQETQRLYSSDARLLADALYDALPGGTIDRLLIELMERRVSLLRVGFLSIREPVAVRWGREPRWAKGQRVEFAEAICEQEPGMRGRGGTVLAVDRGALSMCQVLFDGEDTSRVVPETHLSEHRAEPFGG